MSLGTFGVVLKFAIDLEATAAAFYETAITITQNQEIKSLFEMLVIYGQQRIQTLMRVRRENTTEMILEPISGLEGEKYRPYTECPPECPDDQLLKLAIAMEQKIHDFYSAAVDKVGFLSEVADIFEKLAEDHIESQKRLQTTG